MPRPRLFLIDAFGFIFRAYHARARSAAPSMRTSAGLSTEAVFIFNNMLRKLRASYQPDYVAAVFESKGPTFRDELFPAYKATRPEAPPDLVEQIPYVRRLLESSGIPVLEREGFEADDVIGTIARAAERESADVVIVSSDKDLLQLVTEHVSMLNPAKEDLWYDEAKVEEYMGVTPAQIPDLLALKGDAVDNIPGAPGIGEKGARDLIRRFGSVESALDHAAEVERKTYRESLAQNRDQVLLSKRLATVDTEVPIERDLPSMAVREADISALRQLYRELEFHSLLKQIEDPPRVSVSCDYRSLESEADVEAYVAAIPQDAPVAVTVAGAAEGQLPLATLGLAWKAGEGRSVSQALLAPLRPLLEDAGRPKIAHDVKSLLLALARAGVEAKGFEQDVMLYAFLLDADPLGCSLDGLASKHLDRQCGAGAEQTADCVLELAGRLSQEIRTQALEDLYRKVEFPLVPVLARMERTGIRITPSSLSTLSARMDASIRQLTAEIHSLAGRPFNINSPRQLAVVLFEELKLPAPARRGKSKALSTAADVLESLAQNHEIVGKVLEYRQLAKLKGTYVDALPALIDPATGRLHTSLNQTGAATGRLSSSNPNLQNIPIRTELGREIRAAFVPREGWKLVVADYSQIELRLLAHMSGDPVLVEAFRNGEDIHTRTAAEVFGVPPLMVTPELRRNAKAVNFGIVYGLSAFGLSGQLGISRRDAETYIDGYFERYAGVRKFIDSTIAEVRKSGMSRTLLGRRRPIPDINSRNPNARSFAERTAVNTPIQGTAADLIKLAMVRIDRELDARKLQAAMLLQVHDELMFEAPPSEVAEVKALVKHEMEQVYRLEVPLLVDVGTGDNWRDAK